MSLSVEIYKKVSAQQTIMSNSAPASRPAGAGGGRLAQFKVIALSKYTYYGINIHIKTTPKFT